MSKLAVIGDKESILAFKALGIDVHSPETDDEAKRTINQLVRDKYGVIFITEEIVKNCRETIAQYDDDFIPAIIPIPSHQGSLNIGMEQIDKNVEKAVGINLF